MHWFSAGVALLALVLYADRSGWLFVSGSQTVWATITRLGIGGLLLFLALAFADLALARAAFKWRHVGVLAALIVTCVGHIGLRFADVNGPQSPT